MANAIGSVTQCTGCMRTHDDYLIPPVRMMMQVGPPKPHNLGISVFPRPWGRCDGKWLWNMETWHQRGN